MIGLVSKVHALTPYHIVARSFETTMPHLVVVQKSSDVRAFRVCGDDVRGLVAQAHQSVYLHRALTASCGSRSESERGQYEEGEGKREGEREREREREEERERQQTPRKTHNEGGKAHSTNSATDNGCVGHKLMALSVRDPLSGCSSRQSW